MSDNRVEPIGSVRTSRPVERASAGAAKSGRTRRIAGATLALALLAGAAWGWVHLRSAPPVRYATALASQGVVERAVTATGTLNPVLTIIVGSYVSGVHPAAFLRLQHAGQGGPDLRQDRSAPLSDGGRPGQGQPRRRQGAAAEGPGQPRLHRSSTTTRSATAAEAGFDVAGRRRQRQERTSTRRTAQVELDKAIDRAAAGAARGRRRSISAIPTSSRRSTAPSSRATSRRARPWRRASRRRPCS